MTEDVKLPSKEELLGEQEPKESGQEPKQTETSTNESSYTQIELEALKQGWKPKDKWEGDPEQHRSAREYLDRGELLGKIKSQSTQLEEIRKAVTLMSEHNKKVYQAGYEKALLELKARKIEALKEGDAELVLKIDDEIDNTKDAIREIRTQPQQIPATSATTMAWLEKNQWYFKDEVARAAADALAIKYAKSHRNPTEEDIYDYIDQELPKELPNKFQKKHTSAPDPDGESNRVNRKGNGGITSFEKLLDSMTDDQRNIAKTLVKSGAISKEEYVKQYNQMMGN